MLVSFLCFISITKSKHKHSRSFAAGFDPFKLWIRNKEAYKKYLVPETPRFEPMIEASPTQTRRAPSPLKNKKKKSQKSFGHGKKAFMSNHRRSGLPVPKRIVEVINFDLPFKTHATSGSVNALACRVEQESLE